MGNNCLSPAKYASDTLMVQAVQAGEGMRVGGARKAILPPALVRLLSLHELAHRHA